MRERFLSGFPLADDLAEVPASFTRESDDATIMTLMLHQRWTLTSLQPQRHDNVLFLDARILFHDENHSKPRYSADNLESFSAIKR